MERDQLISIEVAQETLDKILGSLPPAPNTHKHIKVTWNQRREKHLKEYGRNSIYILLPETIERDTWLVNHVITALGYEDIHTTQAISQLTTKHINNFPGISNASKPFVRALRDLAFARQQTT